jgi:integrase
MMTAMASLKPRTLADGGTVWDVKFRLGGVRTGGQKTETFNPAKGPQRTEKHAKAFKAALEANGHQWPANYVPGVGYVDAALLERRRAELAKAQARPPLPFAEFASRWLDGVASGLESGTAGRYRRILDNHLIPAFGEMDVRDPESISPQSLGAWIAGLRAGITDPDADESPSGEPVWLREPLSPKTIRNLHGLMYSIMQTAVDREAPLRTRNPCAESSKHLPSLEDGEGDEEMVFLSPEEVGLLLGQFTDPDARDFAQWLVGTGLRFNEGAALQVRDFEVMARRPAFRVWRAWKQHADGSWYLGAPKTKAALRRVGLNGDQVDMALPYLAGKGKKDLVFTGPNGGRWTHSTFYTRRWRPALYRSARCGSCRGADHAAGIGRRGLSVLTAQQIVWCGHPGMLEQIPRVHDLRHTHVALLIASGAPLLAISRRLGHKSIQITQDRYGHLLPEVDDDLVAGLGALMARIGNADTPAVTPIAG